MYLKTTSRSHQHVHRAAGASGDGRGCRAPAEHVRRVRQFKLVVISAFSDVCANYHGYVSLQFCANLPIHLWLLVCASV